MFCLYLFLFLFEKAWRHPAKYISVKARPFITPMETFLSQGPPVLLNTTLHFHIKPARHVHIYFIKWPHHLPQKNNFIPGLFGNYEKCDKPARVVFKPLPLPIVWGPTVQGPICLEPSAKFAKFAKQCKSHRAVVAVLEARFAVNSDLF